MGSHNLSTMGYKRRVEILRLVRMWRNTLPSPNLNEIRKKGAQAMADKLQIQRDAAQQALDNQESGRGPSSSAGLENQNYSLQLYSMDFVSLVSDSRVANGLCPSPTERIFHA